MSKAYKLPDGTVVPVDAVQVVSQCDNCKREFKNSFDTLSTIDIEVRPAGLSAHNSIVYEREYCMDCLMYIITNTMKSVFWPVVEYFGQDNK
jgi:hypothetical protein